jgi:NAD(P)-dependent dehydrogenase (short-subunit alcohol dehydrogenase family)
LELGLQGKIAIVTGGSDGLGRATALRLAAEGCKVAICARRADHLEAAAAAIAAATSAEVLACRADVASAADIDALVDATVARFGGVDILVNNAGTSAAASLEAVDEVAWARDIELKLMAAVRLCRCVIPIMRERGGGAVVNATIIGGKAPAARSLPTSVTRAAGINLTKSLANEYAGAGIRVNTVCIGLLKSAQWERRAAATGRSVDEIYAEMAARVPLGRIGEAEEYAELVAFLVSARAAYITGTAINLDGGMSPVV